MIGGLNAAAVQSLPDFSADDVNRLLNLVRLFANPEASIAALQALAAATTEAQARIEEAAKREANIATAAREHKARLNRERDQHDRELAEAQARHQRTCSEQMDEINAQRRNAEQLMAKARADADAAALLKADLQRRVEAIKTATA